MGALWQTSWLRSRDDPLLFAADVLNATPEPWQAEALQAVGRHDRVSIRSGHGVGKTTLEAWLILWFLLTRQNCKIPVAANSQDQLRDTIWPEIGKWHRQLPDALKAMIDVQAERIVVVHDPEGAFAVRRTASKDNPEALQRKIPRDIDEEARDFVRSLAGTPAFEQSRHERKRIEMLFAHLKRILKLGRLRLRGPRGAQDEFLLAATAQNLRKLAKLRPDPPPALQPA